MLRRRPTDLPIEAVATDVAAAVASGDLILTAAPGAGKSSVVPLLATGQPGRVLLLEPRRLAARATAQRLAASLEPSEEPGGTVALTMRGERRGSARSRIEVMTEAVLTNRLQRDPSLEDTSIVIFDEFHERNLHSDLGLAMLLEARQAFDLDLRIIVMSATLDVEALVELFTSTGSTPAQLTVPGRTHDVSTHHRPRPPGHDRRAWAGALAATTRAALTETDGSVLAFVPGRAEIDLVRRSLQGLPVGVTGLHGSSPPSERRAALAPGTGRRVVVATAVAETSLTLPDITAVVDGGLERRAVYDADTGLGRLETVHVTRFAADQRRGRAGRLGPGVCWRLWSREDDRHLQQSRPPEIEIGDPLPVAFELAAWGDPRAEELPLLDRPPPHRLRAAREILHLLGLVDDQGVVTALGRTTRRLGLHPRLAVALLRSPRQLRRSMAETVALLEQDRPLRAADVSLARDDIDTETRHRARRLLDRLDTLPAHAATGGERTGSDLAGVLARAWPDRIAAARPERPGAFQLATGPEVTTVEPGSSGRRPLSDPEPFARDEFIVVTQAAATTGGSLRLLSAVGLERRELLDAVEVETVDVVEWDPSDDRLLAETQRRVGAIVLHREPLTDPPPEAVRAALTAGLRRPQGPGLSLLPWGPDGIRLRDRLAWLHDQDPGRWPDLGDAVLLDRLDEWLDLSACRSAGDLRTLPATEGLLSLLDWELRQDLDRLAPPAIPAADGRPVTVEYETGRPVWSVRLQRLLGLDEHPTVGPAEVPVTVELLSPADRPIQVTRDLPGFWRGSYAAVRADLRGRYPKHAWPEQPWLDR